EARGGNLTCAFVKSWHCGPISVPEVDWKIGRNDQGDGILTATPKGGHQWAKLDQDGNGVVTWPELMSSTVQRLAAALSHTDEHGRYNQVPTYRHDPPPRTAVSREPPARVKQPRQGGKSSSMPDAEADQTRRRQAFDTGYAAHLKESEAARQKLL